MNRAGGNGRRNPGRRRILATSPGNTLEDNINALGFGPLTDLTEFMDLENQRGKGSSAVPASYFDTDTWQVGDRSGTEICFHGNVGQHSWEHIAIAA